MSKACTSICQWVRAMHKYHFVAKAVEPKRVRTAQSSWRPAPLPRYRLRADPSFCLQQALREAQDDLEVTQRILEEAKQHLREVEDGIATMQAKYRECVAKKEELEMKCEQCEQRLGRADKVREPTGRPVPFLASNGQGRSGQSQPRGPSPASHSPLHKAALTAHQWTVG